MTRKLLFLLSCCLLLPLLKADRLVLDDGSVLKGTLKSLTDGTLVFSTGFAGELKIAASKVVSLETDAPVEIATQAGQRLQGRMELPAQEAQAGKSLPAPLSLPLQEVKYLSGASGMGNSPWTSPARPATPRNSTAGPGPWPPSPAPWTS